MTVLFICIENVYVHVISLSLYIYICNHIYMARIKHICIYTYDNIHALCIVHVCTCMYVCIYMYMYNCVHTSITQLEIMLEIIRMRFICSYTHIKVNLKLSKAVKKF